MSKPAEAVSPSHYYGARPPKFGTIAILPALLWHGTDISFSDRTKRLTNYGVRYRVVSTSTLPHSGLHSDLRAAHTHAW